MSDYLLLESGFKLILEDGSGFLLLESSSGVITGPWIVTPSDAAVGGVSTGDAARGGASGSDSARGGVSGGDS